MSFLPSLAAIGAGIASHLLYFKHGEHHLYSLRYIQGFVAVSFLTIVVRNRLEHVPVSLALVSTATFAVLFFTGLYSSLLVWRTFFNPLNKIPGPYGARISRLGQLYANRRADRHRNLRKLHEQFGKYVRLGPNDISVTDPRAINVINGVQSKCTKAAWYDMDYPLISLHTTRDRAGHDRRRRVWSPAFSDKALRGYEMRIQKYNDMLMNGIEARTGGSSLIFFTMCFSSFALGINLLMIYRSACRHLQMVQSLQL